MRRIVLTSLALVLGALPLRARERRAIDRLFFPDPASNVPVEKLSGEDLPLNRDGADERTAKYLEPFGRIGKFDYTVQLITEEESFRVYKLVYPSPFETPWPQNNIVPAEYYVPRAATATSKVPAAIVLDIMDGSAILPRMMARSAAQNGIAAIYLPMPYYNTRRPPGDPHEQVMDVRRAKAILVARPEVDAQRLGITGISMGGIMTALAAGVDGEFARVCPILSGGDLATIIFHAHETRRLRTAMTNKGMDRDRAAEALVAVDPLTFASRIGADRCLMINAAEARCA